MPVHPLWGRNSASLPPFLPSISCASKALLQKAMRTAARYLSALRRTKTAASSILHAIFQSEFSNEDTV
jgi:hypothetical protein